MSFKSNIKTRYDRPKSGHHKSGSYEIILECLQNCINQKRILDVEWAAAQVSEIMDKKFKIQKEIIEKNRVTMSEL